MHEKTGWKRAESFREEKENDSGKQGQKEERPKGGETPPCSEEDNFTLLTLY